MPSPLLNLVLYQPDIPQNVGTILRLGACFGIPIDVIEPCGFVFDDRKMRRAGMDYARAAPPIRHVSWNAYRASAPQGRLVLLSVTGADRLDGFAFLPGDRLLLGQESAGVPQEVRAGADRCLTIPMRPGFRSLNVALAAAIASTEALRQLGGFALFSAPTP